MKANIIDGKKHHPIMGFGLVGQVKGGIAVLKGDIAHSAIIKQTAVERRLTSLLARFRGVYEGLNCYGKKP